MKMANFFRLLSIRVFFCGFLAFSMAACLADDVHLSINLTNNVIPAGSMFSIFAEMKNTSTNAIYMSESTPEQDFSVSLTDASGTVYHISRTPIHIAGSTELKLNPGDKHDWIIQAWVSRYYDPPGFTPTHKNVPAGNYTLNVTTKIATRYKIFNAGSNLVKIQIQ